MNGRETEGRRATSSSTDNLRVESVRPLLPPAILLEEYPISEEECRTVQSARDAAARILRGEERRLLVVVGPCSIHDAEAGFDYAQRLQRVAAQHADQLLITMRVYFEKPRSTVGWKGLINDPDLDGSFNINRGLRVARKLLRDTVSIGLPTATEFLDPITPQFIADLVSWAAIGARTSESQVHREKASGLSMPVGFKNGTSGDLASAIDGVISARHPHHFLGVTKQGIAAIIATRGNSDGHVILRGGASGPNYSEDHLRETGRLLEAAGLPPRVVVDCSHANSDKDYQRQVDVAQDLCRQLAAGSQRISGVMLESFIEAGRQSFRSGQRLCYGQSITDACLSWGQTEDLLGRLADAVARGNPA